MNLKIEIDITLEDYTKFNNMYTCINCSEPFSEKDKLRDHYDCNQPLYFHNA